MKKVKSCIAIILAGILLLLCMCGCSEEKDIQKKPIAIYGGTTVAITEDGKIVGNDTEHDSSLKSLLKHANNNYVADVASVAVGEEHILILCANGTVYATGKYSKTIESDYAECGQCEVEDWEDIVAISAGAYHSVGLKSDGTVVATGENEFGQCDVEDWKDIVAISASHVQTIGLKSDGTVVATGDNNWGQCNVKNWKDIVYIYSAPWHTFGITEDGKILAVGPDSDEFDFDGWENVVMLAAGSQHVVGLKKDGTLYVTTDNGRRGRFKNLEKCKDVKYVATDDATTVILKKDGSVVSYKELFKTEKENLWDNIMIP